MNVLLNLLLFVQIASAIVMVGLIVIQHGKGADMGAAFGSGSSGSLFGASGSSNFLSKFTALLATVFFVCTLALAYFGMARPTGGSGSVLERAGAVAPAAAPAPSAKPANAADQIPGAGPSSAASAAPASAAAVPAAPAAVPAASGAAQIPGK
jgi:preprotein translocase subunit SecG